MNIPNLRASLPPRGKSVLAHRLRIDIVPQSWLPALSRWGRIALVLWFSFQFTVGFLDPFAKPVGVSTLIGVAFGTALFHALNAWLSRFDTRVLTFLAARFHPTTPLVSEFRDWDVLTTRLAASPFVVQA